MVAGLAVVAGVFGAFLAPNGWVAVFMGAGVPAGPRSVIRMLVLLRGRGGDDPGFHEPEEIQASEFDDRPIRFGQRVEMLVQNFIR